MNHSTENDREVQDYTVTDIRGCIDGQDGEDDNENHTPWLVT